MVITIGLDLEEILKKHSVVKKISKKYYFSRVFVTLLTSKFAIFGDFDICLEQQWR